NISRSGILMEFDSAGIPAHLKAGDPVRAAIDLPRHPLFSARCLECAATVVRLDAAPLRTQVAVSIGRICVREKGHRAASRRGWSRAPIVGPVQ
ncbi:MAG TPA: hypothetical protein VLH09_14285, partial [Bryobacteraceae bacterium]|nr:hypothetical protein [Bryobacteraceae bacterium]